MVKFSMVRRGLVRFGMVICRLLEWFRKKMRIIILCGSTRFREEYDKANAELTLAGNIVLSVGLFGKTRVDVGKD